MRNKAKNYLGIMRKARACALGETDCGTACRGGKAKLLLVAADASENARRRADGYVYGRGIPLVPLPYTKLELEEVLGRITSMIAVTDLGLANAFMAALAADGNGEYTAVSQQLSQKLEAETRRKKEQQAHRRNQRFGKRRNQA